jgi:hypothetical protein
VAIRVRTRDTVKFAVRGRCVFDTKRIPKAVEIPGNPNPWDLGPEDYFVAVNTVHTY